MSQTVLSCVSPELNGMLELEEYYYGGTGREEMHSDREETDFERDFCSDFLCCGVQLPDLHALLQHYEQSHVKVEDWGEQEPEHGGHLPHNYPHGPGKFENFAYYNEHAANRTQIVAVGVEPQDAASETPSAFDTTVFRTVSPAQYPSYMFPPKRPRSAPVSILSRTEAISNLRAMLPPVFSNSPSSNSLQLIHSALSSTINPPPKSSSSIFKRAYKPDDSDSSEEDGSPSSNSAERPYICLVSGCGKTYKNPNGLKYHTLHGHDRDGKDMVEKPHRCLYANCAKRYKNPNGLKYHIQHGHSKEMLFDRSSISAMKSIAELNQIEAALKREQALRAQLAMPSGTALISPASVPPNFR